jgi:hypothetical protein
MTTTDANNTTHEDAPEFANDAERAEFYRREAEPLAPLTLEEQAEQNAIWKPCFTLRYLHRLSAHEQPKQIARKRAAYLLKAARSRKRGNVLTTTRHTHRLLDCGTVLEIQREPKCSEALTAEATRYEAKADALPESNYHDGATATAYRTHAQRLRDEAAAYAKVETAMPKPDAALLDFAKATLRHLEQSKDWTYDTAHRIAQEALARGLADQNTVGDYFRSLTK